MRRADAELLGNLLLALAWLWIGMMYGLVHDALWLFQGTSWHSGLDGLIGICFCAARASKLMRMQPET